MGCGSSVNVNVNIDVANKADVPKAAVTSQPSGNSPLLVAGGSSSKRALVILECAGGEDKVGGIICRVHHDAGYVYMLTQGLCASV